MSRYSCPGTPGEVADIRAELLEARAYKPQVKLRLVPPLFRRPEYRYVAETGCPNLCSCGRDCRTCPDESAQPWVTVGRLVDLSPDPGQGYPRVRYA